MVVKLDITVMVVVMGGGLTPRNVDDVTYRSVHSRHMVRHPRSNYIV